MNQHRLSQITASPRFAFGQNWQQFLQTLDEAAIQEAETALKTLFQLDSLAGQTFLDIGSGSGLHSLAARRLGAAVVAFDNDPDSVACTRQLQARFRPNDESWRIVVGSILDASFVSRLGQFELVYAWGVLHHTGAMRQAVAAACGLVKPDGLLALALYNAHWTAPLWKRFKYLYLVSPDWLKNILVWWFSRLKACGALLTTGRLPHRRGRGMKFTSDEIDWLGGYPYEYAAIADVTRLIAAQGFDTRRVTPTQGWTGCNEFVFQKRAAEVAA